MKIETKRRALEVLDYIIGHRREPDGDASTGLCYWLEDAGVFPDYIREGVAQWPEYSGNHAFPVPSFDAEENPCDAWCTASEDGVMYEGEYGAARLRLAKFLRDRIANEE